MQAPRVLNNGLSPPIVGRGHEMHSFNVGGKQQ